MITTASPRQGELRRELEGTHARARGPQDRARLGLTARPEAAPIELHPNLAELYRRKVGEL
jgi:hypothetical protein